MSKLLRRLLVWTLPALVLLLAVVLGFAFWAMGTQSGTRILLSTAASQLDGEAVGISGTMLDGVTVQHLAITLPGLAVAVDDLNLVVDWTALNARRVHVRELAARQLTVALSDTDTPKDAAAGGPFSLPVDIAVDRLAIDTFNFTQNGQPLPVALSRLQATLAASGDGAQLRVSSLHIAHDLAQTDVEADINLKSLTDPYPLEGRLIAAATGVGTESPLCLDRYLDPAGHALALDAQGRPMKAGSTPVAGAAPVDRALAPGQATTQGKTAAQKKTAAQSKAAAQNKAAAQHKTVQNKAASHPQTAAPGISNAQANARVAGPAQARYNRLVASAGALQLALSDRATAAVAGAAAPDAATSATAASCAAVVTVHASGSLDAMTVKLDGEGSGLTLAANADLTPRGLFPLRRADAALTLADGSGLTAQIDWTTEPMAGFVRDVLKGTVATRRLDVARLAGGAMPQALLTTDLAFSAELRDQSALQQAQIDLTVAEGSRWNKQPLGGRVSARVATDTAVPTPGQPQSTEAQALSGMRIDNVDIDLKLGPNHIQAQGSLGATESAITLAATAPKLDAFWPDLPGGADLKARLAGTIAAHQGELTARYTPANARENALGRARADAALAFSGGWGRAAGTDAQSALVGWRGRLSKLTAAHAGFDVGIARQIDVSFLPDAQAPLWQWQVGAAEIGVGFPNKQRMTLAHAGSRGGAGRWETAGRIDNATVSPALIDSIMRAIDPEAAQQAAQQAARDRAPSSARSGDAARSIGLDASWDLKFAGALSGRARINRRNGDIMIPGDPPIPLALRALDVDLVAKPTSGAVSRVDATFNVVTGKMGSIKGSGSAMLNGLALDEKQPLRAKVDADIADLAWVGLFTGDSIELGGAVTASIDTQGTLAGPWRTSGTIRGSKLRVIRIDDGVRLFDGTLTARLEDNTLILDSLRFPASLRVMPDEWRTRTWITENEGAKGGYIEARGRWNLLESVGNVRVDVHRFPALQRSDRYAMISGVINIDAALPRLTITGDLTADAGWVSLEILQSVPSLDDDVRVVRPGTQAGKSSTPMQVGMNLKFDMGPRFYITGMGLDAGLVGDIQIILDDGRLSGAGALRTRGGRIEAYGQKLQLRRGTITFQGALDNPILDIEALRTGEQVEAGVRVVGTAQRPRIDLVSYPDVDDVAKLSWLILGRGPDESGADTALLLSVGTALLGGGEPFYRRFGLDDVSVRSGAIGSSGSLLPDRTVAGDVNRDSDSDLATQFLVASKKFANGITLSVEQAMAGSETVGRASYALSRRLSVDLKGGSINGLSLIYRTFFND